MKKKQAALTILAIVLLAAFRVVADPASPERALKTVSRSAQAQSSLASEFVEATVNLFGQFTMGTRVGDPDNPNDDDRVLLFGHPAPETGFTTVRVDDEDFANFQANFGQVVQEPVTDGDVNEGIWLNAGIRITQHLELVRGASTGQVDNLLIRYILENVDNKSHQVGVRLMLDTMLGFNDGAPFRVPSLGGVTHESQLRGDQIPEYYQAFDSLIDSTVVSQGTLIGSRAVRPDKVIWVEWQGIIQTLWEYPVTPEKEFNDSAVALYWNPVTVKPGETRVVGTYYGLSGVDIDRNPPLVVGLTAARQLEMIDGHYSPNPFTVAVYIENTVPGVTTPAEGAFAKLLLPAGLEFAEGESARRELGVIEVGDNTQAFWKVVATGGATGDLLYTVQVGADNVESKNVSRAIQVPLAGQASLELAYNITYKGPGSIILNDTGIHILNGGAKDKLKIKRKKGVLERPLIQSIRTSGSLKRLYTQGPVGDVEIAGTLYALTAKKCSVANLSAAAFGAIKMQSRADSTSGDGVRDWTSLKANDHPLPEKRLNLSLKLTGVGLGDLVAPGQRVVVKAASKKTKTADSDIYWSLTDVKNVLAGDRLSIKVKGGNVLGHITALGEVRLVEAKAVKSRLATGLELLGGVVGEPLTSSHARDLYSVRIAAGSPAWLAAHPKWGSAERPKPVIGKVYGTLAVQAFFVAGYATDAEGGPLTAQPTYHGAVGKIGTENVMKERSRGIWGIAYLSPGAKTIQLSGDKFAQDMGHLKIETESSSTPQF